MAVGTFIVEELRQIGGSAIPEGGTRFEWNADRKSAPFQPWTQGGEQRVVRTDYPGATEPTFQILGPKHTQTTVTGRWTDKYNFPGFAREQMAAFESLCRRGNLVRISFVGEPIRGGLDEPFGTATVGGISLEGVIVSWKFDYRRRWDIGYEFTLDPTKRPEDEVTSVRAPPLALSAKDLINRINTSLAVLDSIQDGVPAANLAGTASVDVTADLDAIEAAQASLSATLEQRTILPDVEGQPSLFKMATQMRSVGATAFSLTLTMAEYRSDLDLVTRTAMSVLDFEAWHRGLAFNSRLLIHESDRSADQLDERSDPAPLGLYRPFKDESLYSVSERWYGTPHAWHEIADRNNLTSINLTGNELLVIPERAIT